MIKYILKRLGFSLLALFILITIVFFVMQLIPGYPIQIGQNESIEQFQQRLISLGLDQPIIVQYFNYWKNIFTEFNFGSFYSDSNNVASVFFERAVYIFPIAFISFVLGVILGMVLGTTAAVYRGKWQDTLINVFAILFLSVPSFVIATFIIKIASSAGLSTTLPIPGNFTYSIEKMIVVAILPILSLIFSLAPTITYYTRNEMIDVLNQDYIKTALSKGLSYRTVILKHGIRNALIPIISISVPSFLIVISGSIVIETFFGIPGVAGKLIESIQNKEVYYVIFNTLFISLIYFLLQILADLLFTFIDPRIKLAESNQFVFVQKIKSFFYRKKHANNWKQTIKKNSYLEVANNSDFYKHIVANNLINDNRIYLSQETVDVFDLNISKDVLIFENEIYKIHFDNIEGKET